MKRTLVVVGAGGHGSVCADAAQRLGLFQSIVFSGNGKDRGTSVGLWKVEFHDEDLSSLDSAAYQFILGVGQISTGRNRQALFERIQETGVEAATIIAGNASVVNNTAIGPGSLVGFLSIVNIGATVGTNVIVNSRALVEHDAIIGDHVHLSTGSIVNGGAQIGDRCLIGSSAVVLQGVAICEDVVVGAGAVVARNITSPGTYVGVPARKIHE